MQTAVYSPSNFANATSTWIETLNPGNKHESAFVYFTVTIRSLYIIVLYYIYAKLHDIVCVSVQSEWKLSNLLLSTTSVNHGSSLILMKCLGKWDLLTLSYVIRHTGIVNVWIWRKLRHATWNICILLIYVWYLYKDVISRFTFLLRILESILKKRSIEKY